jgi:hypothetical protein
MTDARTPGDRPAAQPRTRGGRRGVFLVGETEARPGILTSEFLLTVVAAVAVLLAGYFSDAFAVHMAWPLFAGIVAAYVLSRGIAKAGSKEGPFIVGRDAEQ